MQIADRCPVHLTLSRGSDVESHMAPVAAGVTPSAGGQHESCMEEACAEG